MSFNYPTSGQANVAEYMASGLPWVTASNVTTASVRIDFPMVTSNITIRNNSPAASGALKVGYTANGVSGSNFFLLEGQQTLSADVRTKSLFVMSASGSIAYSVHAGLTMIDPRGFPVLTGSAIYGTPDAASGSYGYGKAGGWGVIVSGSFAIGSGLG
jgi:hypothetical protein